MKNTQNIGKLVPHNIQRSRSSIDEDTFDITILPLDELRKLVLSQRKVIGECKAKEQSLENQMKQREHQWRLTMDASIHKKEEQISQLLQDKLRLESEVRKEATKAAELTQKVIRLKATKTKAGFSKKALPTLPPGKNASTLPINGNMRGRAQTAVTLPRNAPTKPTKVSPSRSALTKVSPSRSALTKTSPSPSPKSATTKSSQSSKCAKPSKTVQSPKSTKSMGNAKTPKNGKIATTAQDNSSGIVTTSKSKEEKKNALGALFASRKPKPKPTNNSGGVDSGSVSKENTANALGALFASRGKPKSSPPSRGRSSTVPVVNQVNKVNAPQNTLKSGASTATAGTAPTAPNPLLDKYYKMKKIGNVQSYP